MDLVQTIALSAGLAWASGLRLYLVVFLAGVLSYFGYLQLPATLAVLQHPLVMAAAGTMALAELVAAGESMTEDEARQSAGSLLPVAARAGKRHGHASKSRFV